MLRPKRQGACAKVAPKVRVPPPEARVFQVRPKAQPDGGPECGGLQHPATAAAFPGQLQVGQARVGQSRCAGNNPGACCAAHDCARARGATRGTFTSSSVAYGGASRSAGPRGGQGRHGDLARIRQERPVREEAALYNAAVAAERARGAPCGDHHDPAQRGERCVGRESACSKAARDPELAHRCHGGRGP